MTRKPFNDRYPANEAFQIAGGLINDEHRALNRFGLFYQHTRGASNHSGTDVTPPAGIMGVALITADDDSGGGSVEDGFDPPNKTEDVYLASFRWFDKTTWTWQQLQDEVSLDAGSYWEGVIADPSKNTPRNDTPLTTDCDTTTSASTSPTAGPTFGPIPKFYVGECVPAYWDDQRGALIPIISPPSDQPMADFVATGDHDMEFTAAASGQYENYAVIDLEIKHAGQDAWSVLRRVQTQIPYINLGKWRQTMKGTAYVDAAGRDNSGAAGTRFRLTGAYHAARDYDIQARDIHLRCTGIARVPSEVIVVNDEDAYALENRFVLGGNTWFRNLWVPGRYRDSPTFTPLGNDIEVDYDDPCDSWFIRIDFEATIFNPTVDRNSPVRCATVGGTAIQPDEAIAGSNNATDEDGNPVRLHLLCAHGDEQVDGNLEVIYVDRGTDRLIIAAECNPEPATGGLPDQTPTNLSPVADSTVDPDDDISWGGNAVKWDLYYGSTANGLVKVLTETTDTSFDPGTQATDGEYAYIVVGYNGNDETVFSDYTRYWTGARNVTPDPVAIPITPVDVLVGPVTPSVVAITIGFEDVTV